MHSVPDHSIRISIDRGGTFTDVFASYPADESAGGGERREIITKLLSVDPTNYKDAPTEGIRRILEMVTGDKVDRKSLLPTDKIEFVRLSTTVATNALLERKGEKHALLITKGFHDLLSIGNQARPRIFDLAIRKTAPLYTDVVEVSERVTLVGFTSDPEQAVHAVEFDGEGNVCKPYSGEGAHKGLNEGDRVVKGVSGEAVHVMVPLDRERTRRDLERLFREGYRSIAVVLAHSYTFPEHELAVGEMAREIGFQHVSLSSQLVPMIKMVSRGISSTADAYLTPVLGAYLDGFYAGFQPSPTGAPALRVEFMGSDGGLLDLDNFSGLKAILSGPAGGVVGFSLTSWDADERAPVIGFDVGGTSTDVSRYDGRYEIVYETTTAGIPIQSPQLDINTVAAGGGSCLTFRNGMFQAGPESAGAHPGPACYRKGGPLALTDANLCLGRLVPEYFPSCFGPRENEPLDPEASERAFQVLLQSIKEETGQDMSLDEMTYGFVTVANEAMARPIRALTEARGFATSKHILASFGGAGGQHACEIAESLGISRILIHRYSSILSAYGLNLAERVFETQEPSSYVFGQESLPTLSRQLDKLSDTVRKELVRQGFTDDRIHLDRRLNMRFDGTDTALLISSAQDADFDQAFKQAYQQEFGFLLESRIMVDDVNVKGLGKTFDNLGESAFAELRRIETRPLSGETGAQKTNGHQSVYVSQPGSLKGARQEVPVYLLDKLEVGDVIQGPALIIDATQTIFVNASWQATVTSRHLVITREATSL
ncbi:hypothetical protein NliqN6_5138 [Naganishia liquefaciens]|uniref:5-oxoprolinase n=1 Tax=Naganishia liquefaciens TaxID=104408 RepID=A0A8H3YIM6_9TREE|nr:hypothetical protein NliqN6_5138 [Naganishia liquefaciens]